VTSIITYRNRDGAWCARADRNDLAIYVVGADSESNAADRAIVGMKLSEMMPASWVAERTRATSTEAASHGGYWRRP
jgi:hypothetical protein